MGTPRYMVPLWFLDADVPSTTQGDLSTHRSIGTTVGTRPCDVRKISTFFLLLLLLFFFFFYVVST